MTPEHDTRRERHPRAGSGSGTSGRRSSCLRLLFAEHQWPERLERGWLTVLASVPLMVEYEAVATRPEHLDAAGLTEEEVRAVLAALAAVVEPVRLAFLWRPTLTDVADDMVLETAVNGRADVQVPMNRRDSRLAIDLFDVMVLSPAEALAGRRRTS